MTAVTLHATTVAIGGRGVVIAGASGRGKSDLALRLIDRGAVLVSDDYTLLSRVGDDVLARAPDTIAGKLEVRHLGILTLEAATDVPICLVVDLDAPPERMPPEGSTRLIAGLPVPVIALAGLEPSAPIKVERALTLIGRPPRG